MGRMMEGIMVEVMMAVVEIRWEIWKVEIEVCVCKDRGSFAGEALQCTAQGNEM